MPFILKYINVFDDINSSNLGEIQEFYKQANLRLEDKFESPSFNEAQILQTSIESMGEFSEQNIAKHLMTYAGMKESVAKTIANNLETELMQVVPSKSAIKSNYGKLAFWIKTLFIGVLNEEVSSIYIKGTPTKHELYMLYIASKLSNNVVIVDNNFKAETYKLYNNVTLNISGTTERLGLTLKDDIDFDKAISMIDGNLTNITPGTRVIIIGEDAGFKLNTALVNIEKLVTGGKKDEIILLKEGVIKPTFDESSNVAKPTATSVEQLTKLIGIHMFNGDTAFKSKAVDFIKKELSTETNVGKAINKLIAFICLYNRYKLSEKLLICYGEIEKVADTYIKFLSTIGIVTIVIDTYGQSHQNMTDYIEWVEVIAGNKVQYHSYPTIVMSNTIAYNASKEIDTALYTGQTLGMYRDRQYNSCNIVTLMSTIDELLLLWKQDATYRPSFASTSTSVTVPVFYTKLTGVGGSIDDYTNLLGKLITEHTIVCYGVHQLTSGMSTTMKINHLVNIQGTTFKEQKLMYKNGGLDIDTIMKYSTFTYRHLEVALQYHILSKLDVLIKENWIEHSGMTNEEYVDTVLNIGLNLSRQIQQEMQWFDYTKQSPKLIVLSQDETIMNIEQSIIITLLHLCGWDIVLAVPTCNNILGSNIKLETVQNHILGEPKFNTNISSLKPTVEEEKKKGFFSRLFN